MGQGPATQLTYLRSNQPTSFYSIDHVAKIYVLHVESRGVWGNGFIENFAKLDARTLLLRPFFCNS